MAVTCPACGHQYDVTLFQFDNPVQCDCGSVVSLEEPQRKAIRNDQQSFDIVIVGAGIAGLSCAYKLLSLRPGLKILILEKGKPLAERTCPMQEVGYCINCPTCDIITGVGGSGMFSDGTLNLRHDVGGNLDDFTHNEQKSIALVQESWEIFQRFGVNDAAPTNVNAADLKTRAAQNGIDFVHIPQVHIGSDKAPEIISRIAAFIASRGTTIVPNTSVAGILRDPESPQTCIGVLDRNGRKYFGHCVLLAPGRSGNNWVEELCRTEKIDMSYDDIDIGVRVEVPQIIMKHITDVNRDPKLIMRTPTYDDRVRTFCTNVGGFVVKEAYEGFICVNGHSFKSIESPNTNFAFLSTVRLTEPLENTTKYGISIAKLATTIGGGKPLVQRLGDLRRHRRSTTSKILKNRVVPTLREYTAGDLAMALTHRLVTNIREGLDKLSAVIPGINDDSTLLYTPEVKFYSLRVCVDEHMQTSLRNLFAAGDGCGLSRDIINASATGILAAEGIIKTLGESLPLQTK